MWPGGRCSAEERRRESAIWEVSGALDQCFIDAMILDAGTSSGGVGLSFLGSLSSGCVGAVGSSGGARPGGLTTETETWVVLRSWRAEKRNVGSR